MKKGEEELKRLVEELNKREEEYHMHARNSKDTYEKMISAIDDWLTSRSMPVFKSPEAEEKFKWRVEMEKISNAREIDKFIFFSKLLNEIGDKEFIYEEWIYNNHSIRAKLIEYYPTNERNKKVPKPSTFFIEMYNWYKDNMTSKLEQIYWLRLFLDFLSDLDEIDLENDMVYNAILDIVKQYLAIAKYYSTSVEKSEITAIDTNAYNTRHYLTFSSETAEDFLLKKLIRLVESTIGGLLKEEDKATIVKAVVSDFPDADSTVKIFARWGNVLDNKKGKKYGIPRKERRG